jgi:hypothetical protein
VEQDTEGGYVWEYLEGYSVKSDLTRSDASELMTSVTALGQEYSAISDAEFRQLRETAKVQDQNVTGLSFAASGYPSKCCWRCQGRDPRSHIIKQFPILKEYTTHSVSFNTLSCVRPHYLDPIHPINLLLACPLQRMRIEEQEEKEREHQLRMQFQYARRYALNLPMGMLS